MMSERPMSQRSASPTGAAHHHSGEEMSMNKLRKIYRQHVGHEIYEIPQADAWAHWRDADAVQYHCTLIARRVDGIWYDADGERVPATDARRYGAMRSIGISTR